MKNFVQPGNNLTLLESQLVHPAHADGFVDSGDQVVCGNIVGVAATSAAADTDKIAVVTTGVFNLPVKGINAGGNVAIAVGDKIYIDSAADGALNAKVANKPFGIALGAVAGGATTNIDVMVTGF